MVAYNSEVVYLEVKKVGKLYYYLEVKKVEQDNLELRMMIQSKID